MEVGMEDTTQDIKDEARKLLTLMSQSRFDEARTMLHPDIRWWVVGQGYMSFERLVEISDATEGHLSVRDIRFTAAIAEGSMVAIEAVGEMAFPDGRPYRNTYSFLIKFQDRLVIEMREYFDTDYALKIFGSDFVDGVA